MSSCTPLCFLWQCIFSGQSERNDKQRDLAESQEEIQQRIREKEEGVKLLQQEPRRSSELELPSQTHDHISEALTESSQINYQSPAFGKHKLVDPSKKLQEHPDKFTIAVLGKNPEFNNTVKNAILRDGNDSDKTVNEIYVEENNSFRIISIHDFFNEECLYPDQKMIDTHCSSGVNLFILAIDSEHAQEDNADSQINKLKDIFGETVTQHLAVVFEKYKSYKSHSQLKEMFHIELGTLSEHLADDCKSWCSSRPVFKYNYKNYSEEIQKRRKNNSKRKRNEDDHEREGSANLPTCTHDAPAEIQEQTTGKRKSSTSGPEFNIVLLGQTGTGKSASGNTILTAGNPELDPSQLFESRPSSNPVTSKCEFKVINVFGRQVRVVDTPDFFDEDGDPQAEVEECKKYCQPGHCVVLLVIQMGRFTDEEREILERLEEKLGWSIRENTIVLLTHGENAKGQEQRFIAERTDLKSMVQACGDRFHVFKNTFQNREQVMELFKKIPDYEKKFPKLSEKQPLLSHTWQLASS